MLIGETISVAIQSIRANKLRAMLTTLGIVIGVAAVITMVALGTGAQKAVQDTINALGPNLLTVYPGQSFMRGVASNIRVSLTTDDADDLLQQRHPAPGGGAGDADPAAGQVRQHEHQHHHRRHHAEFLRGQELQAGLRAGFLRRRQRQPGALRGPRVRHPRPAQRQPGGDGGPDPPDRRGAVRDHRGAAEEGRAGVVLQSRRADPDPAADRPLPGDGQQPAAVDHRAGAGQHSAGAGDGGPRAGDAAGRTRSGPAATTTSGSRTSRTSWPPSRPPPRSSPRCWPASRR